MATLLIASAGGHLKQLHCLRPRLEGADQEVTWVTFDSDQARSLLEGEDVVYAHRQEPRDYRACARNFRAALRGLEGRRFDHTVSTGAGLALAYLPVAAARGTRCHYIESATRADGPSLTGAILRRVPGLAMYTQYPAWASPSWRYRGSVFDGFVAEEGIERPIRRAVVTLGTLDTYPFPRMLQSLAGILTEGVETLWQTGCTPCAGLSIDGRRSLPAAELSQAMADADVVVAHAGTGSALAAIEAGRCPVLVPRRSAFGEHVDDHQMQIAAELDGRGLAISCHPEDLSEEVLGRAARRSVKGTTTPPAFRLSTGRSRRSSNVRGPIFSKT